MRDTIAKAKADVFAVLSSGGVPTVDVVAAYDHEPATRQMLGPTSVTVFSGGMDPDFFHIIVRLYVAVDVDAHGAQDTLDSLMMAVDRQLRSVSFGPSQWAVEFVDAIVSFVAECVVQVGREDF